MSRPYVKIEGPNLAPEYLNTAQAFLPEFIKMDGVVGVTLNGGVSRGYADELSEIDLTVYFESGAFEKLKTGKAPIPFGITMLDGQLFDLKPADIREEEQAEWEQVKLWDASYAKILYDPDAKITALLADKLQSKPAPDAADGGLFACWWCFKLAGDIWLKRGDVLQGHMIMNEAVKYLLKVLFLLNSEYIPHEKWLLHMSRTLEWTPPMWEERLEAALLPSDRSPAGLKARQEAITELWSDMDRRLCALSGYTGVLTFRQQRFYQLFKQIAEKKAVTSEAFEKEIGLEYLKYSPCHELFRTEDNMVLFNETALLGITPDQLYEWQYEIIHMLRGDLSNERTSSTGF
jgi:predicted nucleotidyltransferase